MLNSYDHEDADRLAANVEKVVEPLTALAERAMAGRRPDLVEPLLPPQCILYSALDAYVRHQNVTVPRDGVALIYEDLAGAALKMMERNMRAELTACADCKLEE
ncbi:MAG TPA: hypothetical protein VGW14_04670 [Thermoleophilaceae bacterium]|nr:hypothetical protein [Thermoleophilaceae bacterium]